MTYESSVAPVDSRIGRYTIFEPYTVVPADAYIPVHIYIGMTGVIHVHICLQLLSQSYRYQRHDPHVFFTLDKHASL